MELELSTSPRSVWVWAPEIDHANVLRTALLAAGCGVWAAEGGSAESRLLDIGIGVEALDALTVLAGAGHTFRWHPSQYRLNMTSNLWGMAVAPPH